MDYIFDFKKIMEERGIGLFFVLECVEEDAVITVEKVARLLDRAAKIIGG